MKQNKLLLLPIMLCLLLFNNHMAHTQAGLNYEIITSSAGTCTAVPDGIPIAETLTDDSFVGPIALPFTFDFFENSYNEFFISSNGFISFGSGSINFSNDPLPSTIPPNNYIALFWDDLNPSAGGTISHFNTTFNGQNCYVIEYNGIPHIGDSRTVTGQIILCANGAITLNCIDCQSDGGDGTQGIENINGTEGFFDPIMQNGATSASLENCVTFITCINVDLQFNCELGEEDNFYLDLVVNSINPDETAFEINGGAFPDITAIGTYTIGPFPNGLTTITLEGQTTGCTISYTTEQNCTCVEELIEANGDMNICVAEEVVLEAVLGNPVPMFDGNYNISTPMGDCTATPEGVPTFESLGLDDFVEVPLPFDFNFFGNLYDNVFINSHGFISFGSGSTTLSNDPLPSTITPNNYIALFWDDINPSAGGTISHFNTTFNGQNCYVIEYNGIPHFGNTATVTGQIILCADGAITLNCIDCQSDGGDGTQGIENIDGTEGFFDPILVSGVTFTDLQNCVTFDFGEESCDFVAWVTDLNDVAGTTISTELSTTVSPSESTTYYAIVDCSNGLQCFEEVVITIDETVLTLDCPTNPLSRCNNPIAALNPMPMGGVFSGDFATEVDANGVLDLSNISMSAGTYTLTYMYADPITGCTNSIDCSFELEATTNDANGGRF